MRYASALWGNVKAYFSTFLSLLDTPSTYTGSESKFVKVKADGSGLEFADTPGEANVQSDWNQADTEQDDFIKNKPFLPTFVATGDIYFLHGNASDITNYKKALTDLPDDAEGTVAGTANSTSGEVLIEEFATDSGIPGVTSIPAGYWIFEPYAKIDTLDGENTLKIIAYKRNSLGTETELFNIAAEITGTSPALISITKESEEITLEATDRLVFKYYFSTTSATDRTATLYYEGETNQSRIKLPTDSQVQSDWNEENEDSPAFIKNKPTIPGEYENKDWTVITAKDIEAGTAQEYIIVMKARESFTINSLVHECDDGTLTGCAVKIDGVAVTGLSSFSISTSETETSATGNNTVSVGDRITFHTSTGYTGDPTEINIQLNFTR